MAKTSEHVESLIVEAYRQHGTVRDTVVAMSGTCCHHVTRRVLAERGFYTPKPHLNLGKGRWADHVPPRVSTFEEVFDAYMRTQPGSKQASEKLAELRHRFETGNYDIAVSVEYDD